jgi:hypothetical protein
MQQLLLHLHAGPANLEGIFSSAHRELKPRTPVPRLEINFFPFAGINHTARLSAGQLTIRISDLFNEAPPDVHHALAIILLSKLYRRKADVSYHRTYRAFILSHEIQERARAARSHRGRAARVTQPQGRHVDLEELFVRLNSQYFGGVLERPKISWSEKRSRHILGRYDSTHHAIFISRLFDSAAVPEFVVEYVMYHEMLHLKHQTQVKDCRVVVHTPEFKKDERQFDRYEEARFWLKSL